MSDTKQLPSGTPVTFEHRTGSKSEYIDAVITGYIDGMPCVKTHWGKVYNKVNPDRVTPDPGPETTDTDGPWPDQQIERSPWPKFPPHQPASIF